MRHHINVRARQALGTHVRITILGLASRQELYGQRGHVVALPASAPVGRVAVKVQSGESVLLKCSNIKDLTFLDGTA